MPDYVRNGSPYLVGALVLLGAIVFSLRSESRDRLEKGRAFEAEGRLEDALEQYEWALQSYSPGDSSCVQALDRMRALAEVAERDGATQTAIVSWQAIVSALVVTEHSTQPESTVLNEARDRLKKLRRNPNPAQGRLEEATPEATRSEMGDS